QPARPRRRRQGAGGDARAGRGQRGAEGRGWSRGSRARLRAPGPARTGGRGDRERQPLASIGPARDDGQARLTVAIYLARHGETEWSRSGRHTGLTDLALTPNGEAEAAGLGKTLAGIDFDAVYSSPMERARRTAAIAGFPNPRITPLLREFDYGDYEGKTSAEIHELHPEWQLYRDGCPGGETPAQVYRRARDFIDPAAASSGDVLAFAHGHIMRAISATGIAFRCSGTCWPGSSRKPTTRIDPQSAICSKPIARREELELSADTVSSYLHHSRL